MKYFQLCGLALMACSILLYGCGGQSDSITPTESTEPDISTQPEAAGMPLARPIEAQAAIFASCACCAAAATTGAGGAAWFKNFQFIFDSGRILC